MQEGERPCLERPGRWGLGDLGVFTYDSKYNQSAALIEYRTSNEHLPPCNGESLSWDPDQFIGGSAFLTTYDFPKFVNHDGALWTNGTDIPLRVTYGLAKPVRSSSEVQVSLAFLVVVITCDLFKLIAMLWTLRRSLSFQILTLGDALSSFLETPDNSTVSVCTLNIEEAKQRGAPSGTFDFRPRKYSEISKQYSVSRAIL